MNFDIGKLKNQNNIIMYLKVIMEILFNVENIKKYE